VISIMRSAGTILWSFANCARLFASCLVILLSIHIIQGVAVINNVDGRSTETFRGKENYDLNFNVAIYGEDGNELGEFPSCGHMFGTIKIENTVRKKQAVM